jgi:hypothetical protein
MEEETVGNWQEKVKNREKRKQEKGESLWNQPSSKHSPEHPTPRG